MVSDMLLLLLHLSLYAHSPHNLDKTGPRGRSSHSDIRHQTPDTLRPRRKEKADQEQGRFICSAGHAGKNPLTKCCTICNLGIRNSWFPAHDPEETKPH